MKSGLAVMLLLLAGTAPSQTILLPDRWLFAVSDDPQFCQVQFNDRSWRSIPVPSWWEKEGFDGYDGIAWYRVHFKVQRRLLGREFTLLLGKVDDADQTYLNGSLIGSMGDFPPGKVSGWNQVRTYKIPARLLKTDNVLAVRVYDSGGPGGIVADPIGIYGAKEYKAFVNPPPGPRKSFSQLVTSNGLIAAVYNEKRGRIEAIRPHIFQAYDSARYVQPFLGNLSPVVDEQPSQASYRNHTHVITVTYPSLEISYVAPLTTEEKILYVSASGRAAKVAKCSFTYETRTGTPVVDSVWFDRAGGRAQKYFLFGFTDSLHTDRTPVGKAKERLVANDGSLLEDEVGIMRRVIDHCRMPKGLRGSERAVFEQSVSVLKMAQVPGREIFPLANGQILASLPPGAWNIAWVRDGMYAIMGLNRLGLFEEARQALTFCLRADAGQYVGYRFTDGKEYGVGVPYQVSVCRYFGTGKEESDFNEAGPNIELDGFGLFLVAYCDFVRRSGDMAFFNETFAGVSAKVADAIVHCIAEDDVIRIDSGPWERHLPGKQFAYTTIACAAGLRDFSDLCRNADRSEAEKYGQAYHRLMNGIRKCLVVDERFIKANVEAGDPAGYDYFDGGTFEAFGFGLFMDRSFFYSHLKEYEEALRIPGPRRGFSRVNKGDWYETAEWIFLDLRITSALDKFGGRATARRLLDWVTDQASLNFGLIPELYDEKTAAYDGAIPMVGYGAGVYVMTLFDLYE